MGDPDAKVVLTNAILNGLCGIMTSRGVLLQVRLPAETLQKPTRSKER
jgi:hypothetical protein